MMERILYLEGREIMIRCYSYTGKAAPLMIFYHGGGFVSGSVEESRGVCMSLSEATGRNLVAVEYRLAPEHKFPAAPEDCYEATQEILAHCREWYQADPDDVVLIGDSAGATLACVVSMMARDRGGLRASAQVLIYPAAWCYYKDDTPFRSVIENGKTSVLNQEDLIKYAELYTRSEEDMTNPYCAPLRHRDFSGLPRSLVLTMQYDTLRDEGIALAEKMKDAGCDVEAYTIENADHGVLGLPRTMSPAKEIYTHLENFLTEREKR